MPRRNPRTEPKPTDQAAPATPAPEYRAAVPLDDIQPSPSNVRRDVGDVGELADSIAADGVLEPLVVAATGDGPMELIAGHRRLAAARQAGIATVPCLVRHDLTDHASRLVAMLAENLHRADLSPLEEADAYRQLELAGLDVPEIARRVGRRRSTVQGRLQLLTLPERTRERVHDRQLTLAEAEALAEFADDPKALKTLEACAGDPHRWRWELERCRNARDRARRKEELRQHWEGLGVRILSPREAGEAWGSRLTERDVETLGQTLEAHATSCLAAAISITTGGSLEHYCMELTAWHGITRDHSPVVDRGPAEDTSDATGWQPATSGEGPNQEDPQQRRAEVEAQAARDEADREACAIAARLRREHLLPLTTGRTPLAADDARAVAEAAVSMLQRYEWVADPEGWCRWLTADDLSDRDPDDWEALLAGLLARTDPQRALLAALAADYECRMDNRYLWAPHMLGNNVDVRGWLTTLGRLGYQLSEWEAERLAAAEEWIREQAAPAEDPAPEPATTG